MGSTCGARYIECVCTNGADCNGTTHRCGIDGCRGEWTYDHTGDPVPVITPFGIPVPDSVLAYALRERFATSPPDAD
jgi:hypothetical protein